MRKLISTIIAALALGLAWTAAMMTAEDGTGCQADCHVCRDTGHTGRTSDIHDFRGFIAFNALNGTSERIEATDRQVFVCRNSMQNCGYNPAASKRQISQVFRNTPESVVNQHILSKYHLFLENCSILDGGLSSNSERLHLLRILIV